METEKEKTMTKTIFKDQDILIWVMLGIFVAALFGPLFIALSVDYLMGSIELLITLVPYYIFTEFLVFTILVVVRRPYIEKRS
jgi:hypothetical protein